MGVWMAVLLFSEGFGIVMSGNIAEWSVHGFCVRKLFRVIKVFEP